jgi:hypothetical protein
MSAGSPRLRAAMSASCREPPMGDILPKPALSAQGSAPRTGQKLILPGGRLR